MVFTSLCLNEAIKCWGVLLACWLACAIVYNYTLEGAPQVRGNQSFRFLLIKKWETYLVLIENLMYFLFHDLINIVNVILLALAINNIFSFQKENLMFGKPN